MRREFNVFFTATTRTDVVIMQSLIVSLFDFPFRSDRRYVTAFPTLPFVVTEVLLQKLDWRNRAALIMHESSLHRRVI